MMGQLGLAAGLSAGVAVLLTPLAIILARRTGAVAHPRPDRLSRRKTPLLGGVVIFIAAFLPLSWLHPRPMEISGLLAGGCIIFLVGLVDDLRGLGPAQKVVGQIVAACALIFVETSLGVYGWGIASIPVFILWLVAITNAFNLLDNMDGLAAGVAAITGAVIFLYSAASDAHVALGAACIGAAAVGFVAYNLPPARIYLGDSGSLFLGLVLATLAAKAGGGVGVSGWIVPVMLLGVPIIDTVFVTIGRARAGEPITRGGKDHLSHRLLDFGLSSRKTLLVLYLLSAVLGALILLLGEWPLPLVIAGAVLAIALLGFGGFLSRPFLGGLGSPARLALVVLVDLAVFTIAFVAAYLIRFEGTIPEQYTHIVTRSIPLFVGAKFLVFAFLGLYRGRHRGLPGALRLFYASVLGSLLAVSIATMAWRFEDYSRAVFVIDGMITFLLGWVGRYGSGLAGEALVQVAGRDLRIAIVGTREALALLGDALAGSGERRSRVVGAIRLDDAPGGTGDLADLGPLSRLPEISREHGVRMIWLVGFGMSGEDRERVKADGAGAGLIVREVSLNLEA